MLRVSAKGMLVVVIMALAFMITPVRAEGFAGGSGTAADPYLIETAEQFNTIRYNLTAHYKLTTDIDLSGYENWEPIGTANAPFVGALDGTGHTIGGLSIDRSINDVGLFGSIAGNSRLENITLHIGAGGIKGRDRVGGLAGSASCTNGLIR
ncbi:MAG: hypothetical protein MJB12_03660, partial [Firmicutes bacterium]|nr:hypothetical protein [Bacillota bacterium]